MSLAYSPLLDDQLAGRRSFKKKPVPRAALARAVDALRAAAHDEAAVSQGSALIDACETQEWKDAAAIEKWLKGAK